MATDKEIEATGKVKDAVITGIFDLEDNDISVIWPGDINEFTLDTSIGSFRVIVEEDD